MKGVYIRGQPSHFEHNNSPQPTTTNLTHLTASSDMSSGCMNLNHTVPSKSCKFLFCLLKSCLVELIGSAILVGAFTLLGPASFEIQVVGSATILGLLIWIFGSTAEAHFNPVVSLCFSLTRRLSILRLLCFVICQFLGSLGGSYLSSLLTPNDSTEQIPGMTILNTDISVGQGFVIELLGTGLLVLTILSSVDEFRANLRPTYDLALFTGGCLGICVACIGPLTGCSLNPTRSLGPAIVNHNYENQWVYVVAPFVGGILATLLYELCLSNAASFRRTKAMFLSRDFDRHHRYGT